MSVYNIQVYGINICILGYITYLVEILRLDNSLSTATHHIQGLCNI